MPELMNFTVYTRDGCPYCTKITQLLDELSQSYVVYKLDKDFNRPSFYGEFGEGSTFPQVVLNGKKLGGCSDTIRYFQEEQIL